MITVLFYLHFVKGMVWADWTGLGDYAGPLTKDQRGKTLWDWLELLIIPLVLGVIALWFNRHDKLNEIAVEERRAQTDHEIALDKYREEILQGYIDSMTKLLLEDGLLSKKKNKPELKTISRTRTLTALRRLDGARKGYLLRFIFEAGLIKSEPVIGLHGADLTNAELQKAKLFGACLKGANLTGANLTKAILEDADLSNTNLTSAILDDAQIAFSTLRLSKLDNAHLCGADLVGVDLEMATLNGAMLENAVLRDSKMDSVELRGANLTSCNLENASIARADLTNTNLQNAKLICVDFTHSRLIGAILDGAEMTDSILDLADLSQSSITRSQVEAVKSKILLTF